MKSDKGYAMREYIKSWGLPDCLSDRSKEVVYKFDDEGILNTNEEYCVEDRNFKFCLFEPETGLVLLSMDFFKIPLEIRCDKPFIILELLYVHQHSWRMKGIASFYIQKLILYAIQEKMNRIQVTPDAKAKNFKNDSLVNALSQDKLIQFYQKWDTPEMPFEVIIPENYEY